MGLILWLLVINIITTHVYGEKVPLWNLKPGDTLNINTINLTSVEVFASVFNNNHYGQTSIDNVYYSLIHQKNNKRIMCATLDFLKQIVYPKVFVNNYRLNEPGWGSSNTENRGYFDAFKDYLDESKYLFGLIKVCRKIEFSTLKIRPIYSEDLPIVNGSLVHKIHKLSAGFLRYRRGDETNYVSSITTGNCVFQFYVNEIDLCKNVNDRYYVQKDTNFFRSPVFQSKITRINQNYSFETDPDFSNPNESLHILSYSTSDLLLNHTTKNNLLMLEIDLLPGEPKLSRSVDKQLNVKPGDVLNQYDFSRITLSLMNGSTADDVSRSAPKTVFSYSNCFKYVAPAEALTKSKSGDSGYDYNLDLFEDMVARNNYGVPAEYLTKDYKCYKLTVCSGLYELKAPQMPSFKVVELDKFLGDSHEYNILDDGHTVMRQSNETKLYYVSAMHFGNCLFQAQMFPSSTTFEDVRNHRQLPVYKGHMISASRNQTVEKLVKKVISNCKNSVDDSLFNLRGDLSLPVYNILTDNVLISLDLKQIA